MSFLKDYNARKKKKQNEELLSIVNKVSGDKEELSYADIFGSDYLKKLSALERQNDIAPVRTPPASTSAEALKNMTPGINRLIAPMKTIQVSSGGGLEFTKTPEALKNGVSAESVSSAILGTKQDAYLNAAKGAAGLFEGLGDLLLYKTERDSRRITDMFGVENPYADQMKELAQKNAIDDITGGLQAEIDKTSTLGRTGKGVFQGVGQAGAIMATGGIAGAAGVGSAGVSALTTAMTGLSGMGSGMSEAYEGGATDEEAATYGMISGAADVLTEMIFGGMGKSVKALGLSSGLSSVDDIVAKAVSSKIKSAVAKNIVQFGVKSGFEGLEEVLAGFTQAVGKKLTYMSEEDIGKIIQDENLLEQFVVGAFTSGLTQSGAVTGVNEGSLIDTIQTGKDFITGFSQNEQAVIKAETEKRIAQQETDGKKLTKNEKRAIEAQVEKDMDKGFISTDTIEETLGGEAYQNYKKIIDSEDALVKQEKDLSEESKKLEGMVWEKMTGEQQTRRDELRKTLPELRNKIAEQEKTSTRNQLKEQMQNQVKEMVKEDRLVESYNEQGRRKEAFTADLTKYDAKQQETVKKAMDSGVLNNTNRTHDFVDLIAKVAAKLDKTFDFTNNEKLKESGFALNGKVINGFVNKDGVTINIQSAKALNTVVGHEITHVLEGTDLYTELQNAIVAYAKNKGDYQSRYDTLAELYKGIEGANIDAELTADLVGDYLFTDSDFINKLSTENRNVFQKIFDEVKYLLNLATAGSKEARELEKVKRAFEKAFRDGAQKNTAGSGVKYSIERTKSMSWAEQINGALYDGNNIQRNDTLVVANSAETPVSNEIDNKPLALPLSVLTKARSGKDVSHSIKKGKLTKLDEGIKNAPITIVNPDRNAVVYVTNVKQGGLPIVAAFDMNANFDGDEVHKATSIHLQVDTMAMLENLPKSATVYVQKKDELMAVGATNNLRGLSANIKFIEEIVSQKEETVNRKIEPNEIKITDEQNEKGLDTKEEVDFSLSRDTEYMDHAIDLNESAKNVSSDVMLEAKAVRERVATRMNEIKDRGLVGLPEDIEGNTYIANSSYDGTEENTTICPRSLASEAFVDAVSEYLGRPLSVEEQIYISQDLQGRSLTPECTYCYVATDRKAYRAFLGDYVSQRDSVIDKIKSDPNADTSREGALYKDFLNGRKDTNPMYNRFKMWVDAYKSGKPMIEASHLANINKLMGDINSEFGEELRPQIVDAMKYAQSASWAKKRVNYVAYNGHILKWKQDRIKKLNSHYGLRMYSFSDFHPAFVLENMQMITDASVRGLKMLGYTKDTDFVEIFAPSGMNINVSTFGFEADGNVYENNIIGAEWEKAKALREQYPNVGVTFVATNDTLVNWALEQDWIDVVIPYHLVRTGAEVAKAFNYTNYTSESADTKTKDWVKGNKKYIAPTEHNNDLDTYLKALENNHLKPRFERFLENPNYMKLVNECRQSASQSKPVQPVFNEDAAMVALAKLEANGYYQPIGGSVDRMYEIAAEVAEDMTSQIAPSKNSLSNYGEKRKTYGNYNVYGEDVALETTQEDVAPIQAPVAESTTVPQVNATTEELFPDDLAPTYDTSSGQQAFMPEAEAPKKLTRKELHQNIMDNIKVFFGEKGFDFDKVLKNANNLSTFSTVDNTPQRVMEKALGYKQGQVLSDLTVNKVAQNETEAIKWLNTFTDRKKGILAQISKKYSIKPGSKASAAAQMYAEGFYVGENDAIIEYGDKELAADFPDPKVRENIKKLARDPVIRKIYDDTLEAINESRTRNAYPEIPRLDNYFLHFRAMEDTFSKLGLPFNPNDIRAKDLPTDLNGVTADLKPGQPYFASAKHRTGKRTSFDLLGGLEKYLSSAKNQIYHIDDIQNLRALRNYIADTYGQANGLEGIDTLSEEEAQDRIEKVYGSHLSTFAKFLNEEANVLAGKTSLIDRGLEGVIGRRGITFLDTVNKQVGANMVGFNVSSSLTNFLSVAQGFAKTNKFDFVKAFAQTVANKVGSIAGKTDGFTENSPVIIRRKGEERFYRTPWQKVGDAGYTLMSIVDNISTELLARAKYNELTRKGMDSQKAHIETDKWVSRLMGDRSLGQQPQLYNSKMLGLLTKFQLEVRNQLDSQFYDTIQEAKVSSEQIENRLLRNAKKAAKITSVFAQLAVGQHLFGKAFESIAGYNPAFDIIEVLIKTFGWDDEEEDEDTVLDNIEQGFLELLGDLPYSSLFNGGRVPIESALPIEQFVTGKDQYGNEKDRWETLKEAAPYYILPGGYGQIKKTMQGLDMFDEDLPIAGSYTDSGNLRFPVEDNLANRVQAGLFGQYASENARDYFDNERAPLKEKQIEEFVDLDIPIRDYWDYREGLKDYDTLSEKADYINSLDFTEEQKDVLKSYLFDEAKYAEENPEKYKFLEDEGIGYLGYKQLDEETQESWSWAFKHPEEYKYLKEKGVYPEDYSVYRVPMLDFKDAGDAAYEWAFNNSEKATLGKVFKGGVKEYRQYSSELSNIKADRDKNGKVINGSAKQKKIAYINGLKISEGEKLILIKSLYPSDDTNNLEIVNYVKNKVNLSMAEKKTILTELGFKVSSNGVVTW